MDANTYYSTDKMAAHQVARLRQRAVGSAIYQHRRCPERTYQEHIVHMTELHGLQPAYGCYANKRTQETPEMVGRLHNGLPVHYIFANAVGALDSFFQLSSLFLARAKVMPILYMSVILMKTFYQPGFTLIQAISYIGNLSPSFILFRYSG